MATVTGIQVEISADLSGFNAAVNVAISKVAGMASQVQGMGGNLSKSFNGFNAAVTSATARINDVGKSVSGLSANLAKGFPGFNSAIQASIAKVSQLGSSLQGFGSNFSAKLSGMGNSLKEFSSKMAGMGQSVQNVGSSLSTYLTLPLAGLAGGALKVAGDFDALRKSLESILGTPEAAAEEFRKLQEASKLPGLGLEQATKASIALQSTGWSADRAREAIAAFAKGNSAAGGSVEKFEQAMYGLQQVANTEFVMGEDLNILRDSLPQVTKLLKDAFGTARSEELRTLGVTSAQVTETIIKGLGKLPAVVGGLRNSFDNAGDGIKNTADVIGTAINKNFNVEGIINALTDAMGSLTQSFANMNPVGQKIILVIAGIAAAVGPLLFGVGAVMKILPLLTSGFAALSGVFSILTLKIVAVVAIVAGLALVAKSIYDAWGAIGNFFTRIFAEVKLAVVNGILAVVKGIESFSSKIGIEFDGATSTLEGFAQDARDTLKATPFVSLGDAVGEVGTKIKDNFNSLTSVFSSTAKTANTATTGITTGLNKVAVASKAAFSPEQSKAIKEIQADLAAASQNAVALGSSYDLVGVKADILTKGIEKLTASGLSASSGVIKNLVADLNSLGVASKQEFGNISAIGMAPANGGMDATIQSFKDLQAAAIGASISIPQIQAPLTNLGATLDASIPKQEQMAFWLNDIAQQSINTGAILQDSLGQAFELIGETLGKVIVSGDAGFKDFFAGLIGIVAGFLTSLGKAMIAAGLASQAFQALFANPVAAIAAGVALIATASIVKALLQKGAGGGGMASLARGTDFIPRDGLYELHRGEKVVPKKFNSAEYDRSNDVNVNGEFAVRGSDLLVILGNATKRNDRLK